MSELSSKDASRGKAGKDKRRLHPQERVVVRNRALHAIQRQLLGLMVISLLASLGAIVAAVASYQAKVPPQYIAATEDGRVLPIIPLNEPNMDDSDIGEYALEAVRALNTYDYINWRDQLQQASRFFSSEAWTNYLKEFEETKTMNAVQDRRMIVSVEPTGEPRIVRQAVAPSNIYVWLVEVPIVVKYSAHAMKANGQLDGGNKQEGVVTMYISRVPTTVQSSGVAIQIYQFSPA